jgi:metallo-beta-lactamase class B
MSVRAIILGAIMAAVSVVSASAQNEEIPERERPFPPLRIVGNLYYVGTYDLGCYLITTDEGHILINSGYENSVPIIRDNIETLGFNLEDIKIITTNHAHTDHVGGLAELKRLTGAETYMHEADVPLLVSGGDDDYRYPGGRGVIFPPIEVDHQIHDGSTIELGGMVLTAHNHPGHTKGAVSFSMTIEDGGRNYDVLIANMGTVNDSVNLTFEPGYPDIVEAYESTFASQMAMHPDIWVAPHAGHFNFHEKYQPGMPYSPETFLDPDGWFEKIDQVEAAFRERLVTDASKPRD